MTQKKQKRKKFLKVAKKKRTESLKIPKDLNEQEVIATIEKISKSLSLKFRFGYLTQADLAQEIFILAIQALKKYDRSRPLENFLRVHLRNRLINYKRDNYQRIYELKCKCKLCKGKVEHEIRMDCPHYKKWHNSNLSKKNIILPIGIDQINDERETNTKSFVDFNEELYKDEIFTKLEAQLPKTMLEDYFRIKKGDKINKSREEEIMGELRRIVDGSEKR